MLHHRYHLADTLRGRGNVPTMLITLHEEDGRVFLALHSGTSSIASLRRPGPGTTRHALRWLQAAFGPGELGEWVSYDDTDGEPAGWFAQVDGPAAPRVRARLRRADRRAS